MPDIQNTRILYFKALLFLGLGICSGSLLLLTLPTLRTLVLLSICVWAFARSYYFAFYVVQRYVDPGYRFSGLMDFVMYALRTWGTNTNGHADAVDRQSK